MPAPSNAAADLVARYFDACNSGDAAALKATVSEDVVHYFLPGHPPVRGSDALAKHWNRFRVIFDAKWFLNRVIAAGDDAVSEWSFEYRPAEGEARVVNRGTEWYLIRDGRIVEVRSYYNETDANSELAGFDYAGRGYAP
jgi:ketosteroid isomerase-like protein